MTAAGQHSSPSTAAQLLSCSQPVGMSLASATCPLQCPPQMREAELIKLDEICRAKGVKLLVARSYGLVGYMRVSRLLLGSTGAAARCCRQHGHMLQTCWCWVLSSGGMGS